MQAHPEPITFPHPIKRFCVPVDPPYALRRYSANRTPPCPRVRRPRNAPRYSTNVPLMGKWMKEHWFYLVFTGMVVFVFFWSLHMVGVYAPKNESREIHLTGFGVEVALITFVLVGFQVLIAVRQMDLAAEASRLANKQIELAKEELEITKRQTKILENQDALLRQTEDLKLSFGPDSTDEYSVYTGNMSGPFIPASIPLVIQNSGKKVRGVTVLLWVIERPNVPTLQFMGDWRFVHTEQHRDKDGAFQETEYSKDFPDMALPGGNTLCSLDSIPLQYPAGRNKYVLRYRLRTENGYYPPDGRGTLTLYTNA